MLEIVLETASERAPVLERRVDAAWQRRRRRPVVLLLAGR